MRDIAASEAAPVGHARVRRLRDALLLRHAQGTRRRSTASSRRRCRPTCKRRRGFDVERDVPVVHRLRGRRSATSPRSASWSGRSSPATAALCIGAAPGELYDQKKFDTPYIRDFLLDRGTLADVSETAAPWSALQPVYDAVTAPRARRVRGARRARLHHVPPVALLPRGRVPVLHVRVRAACAAASRSSSTRS